MENASRNFEYTPRIIPLEARRFFLNIIQGADGSFYGSIRQIFSETEYRFNGLENAVLKIDRILDESGGIQVSEELRSFGGKVCSEEDVHVTDGMTKKVRRENSFLVDIMFRQHSSWQGTLTWLNHAETLPKENFRSVLELLRLIQSSFE